MSFLIRRRSEPAESPPPRLPRIASLSYIFTRGQRSSVDSKKTPRVVSDGSPQRHPLSWSTSSENRSSVSSESLSLGEIRRPSGLGQRAESTASVGSLGTDGSIHEAIAANERNHPISQSNLRFLATHPWSIAESTTETMSTSDHDPYETYYMSNEVLPSTRHPTDFPTDLLNAVCRFLSREDLASVARTSTSGLAESRKILYETLDLRDLPLESVQKCLQVLASKRDLASIVRTFASPILPSFHNSDSPLPPLTFSIALYNMLQLKSLSLPRFDADMLHHTSFRLERVVFRCITMSEMEQKQFSMWIANQRELTSLSLPILTMDINVASVVQNTVVDSKAITFGELSFPTPPSQNLVVPKLTHFEGPASLATKLVPGRPVTEVVLHVQKTLYDGLKPSELMASLAKSSSTMTRLSIVPSSCVKVDARTLERLLISAGASIGPSIQTLEVGWILDDDTLYKTMVSVLSRFRNLQTLYLRRRDVLSLPISPPHSPFSSPSFTNLKPNHGVPASLSAPASSQSHSPSSSPLPSHSLSELESTAASLCVDSTNQSREHHYLKSWAKSCPCLETVIFLSGAEWCVMRRHKRLSTRGHDERKLGSIEEEDGKRTVNILSFVRWRLEE